MRHPILAILAVLVVTACGVGASSTPPPSTAGPAAGPLAGRTFLSTAVQGHDLVPDTRVRIVFDPDGTIGVSAGCNAMGGTWLLGGATLLIKISQMTEMGCPDARFAQDDWLIDWLAGGLTATIQGDELVLEGAGVTMTLLDRETADPDQPLEGTTWVLDGIEAGGTVSSVPAGVRATIRVDAGQLTVDDGCNTGSATVTVDGGTLTVGPLAMTKRACQQDASDVERSITQILQGPLDVVIEGATLRLTGPTGGLAFRAG